MTSAYEQNRRNLQNSRNIDPNRFQDQMDTVKQFVNPEDPTFISELFLDLKTGYSAAKNTPGGPYIKGGSAIGAIGLRRLIKQADIPGKIVTNFNDIFKGRTASLLNPPPVSKVNTFNLNDLKAFSFATKVDDLTGITNVKSEVMQMLSKGDDLDIFVKGSNSDLSYKKIAKDYRLASGAGLDLPVVEGYKAANPKTWNKYVLSETKHWAQHGKGSGKYFTLKHSTDPTQNIRYRLDNKGQKVIDGKTIDRSFSLKNLKHKKIENLTQQDRIQILRDTTLDSETVSAVMKLTPGGRIMHHAAPVKSTGKIREAFFKANPNLTQADWIPIQRRVEKELGIAFGDSPLNQRYPKTIAEHNEYHKLLDDAKLYPRQLKFPKGLSPNDAYLKLKELGTTVLEIDKKIGIEPTYTSKSIGKEFR